MTASDAAAVDISGPSAAPPATARPRPERLGVILGVTAYVAWGVFPLYFKALAGVSPIEVLAHRIIWSSTLLLPLVILLRGSRDLAAAIRSRRTMLTLLATTVLIAGNWLVFVEAIVSRQTLQASLGYFINPLFSVLLGYVVLGERLRRLQQASVALAAVGVGYLSIHQGGAPLLAGFLAVTFGLYGLLRKMARADAMVGLTIETTLLLPFAAATLVYLLQTKQAAFASGSLRTDLLLLAAGVITATPLILFAAAARRLPLITLGLLQYFAPTGQFLLAVFVFGEPFRMPQLIAFAFIWAALGVFTYDAWLASRRARSERGAVAGRR